MCCSVVDLWYFGLAISTELKCCIKNPPILRSGCLVTLLLIFELNPNNQQFLFFGVSVSAGKMKRIHS